MAKMLNLSSSGVIAGATPRALQSASTPKLRNKSASNPAITSCAAAKGDKAPQPTPADQAAPANPLQQAQQQQQLPTAADPLIWCQGIAGGTFVQEVKAVFPPVQWTPADLVKILWYALPAAAVAGINSQLLLLLGDASTSRALPPIQSNLDATAGIHTAAATTAAAAAAAAAAVAAAAVSTATSIQQLALIHLSQEAVLTLLLPTACRLALGPRVLSATASPYWTLQTLGTCLLLFPFVDPLLHSAWQPVAEAVFGPAPASSLVDTLQQAGAAGQYGAVAQHCLASGLLGPLWEEVFWRAFFLTALTKVLPLPACIGLSALNFAALHLSPHNFLPLLVLGATCDCLYLRSGGNLLAPLLLHGLWNTSQVLQIALLHKDTFV